MRRLIIEVCQGRFKGNKAFVAPGGALRIGRSDRADLTLPKDPQLSNIHFELSWDGSVCRLHDCDSHAGTSLDGEPVDDARVQHGGWIRAGGSDFCVYFEAHTPRPAQASRPTAASARRAAMIPQARAMLQACGESEPLYAVLDAARSKRILQLTRESVESYRSLYDGVRGETLAHVAPYLVRLPDRCRLLDSLVGEGWGCRWGIYLTSRRPFDEVRRHLRRFLMVEMEETRSRSYFRYYDPRAMEVFWESATVRQRQDFTSQLGSILLETGFDALPMQLRVSS